ncbi:MAG: hypothetical protein ACI3V1_02515 [Faecousia sp.]
MKQTVTDIQDIRAVLDEDDEQLMRMFPRNREAALDEMLLVQKDGEMYLLRKADVARNRKILNGIFCSVTVLACALNLLYAILNAISGSGRAGVHLLLFWLLLFPYIAKVPKEVIGGVRS